MEFIEVLGGLGCVKLEPTIIKIEPNEGDAVEIGINDVFNASDEDNENVACEGTEDKPQVSESKNLNEPVGRESNEVRSQVKIENDEKNGVSEDFKDAGNLQTDEQLIVNVAETVNAIHKNVKKLDITQPVNWAEMYRTCETTSCQDDVKKIIVTKAPYRRVSPEDYTILASDKHVCNICQFNTKQLKQIKQHIRKNHRKTPTMYQCPYCPHKSKWKLNYHLILKHMNEKDIQWFRCHICDMKFKLKRGLSNHMLSHFTTEQLHDVLKVCKICGKGFKRGETLKIHEKFAHNKEIQKRFQCKQCDYSAALSANLKQHVEVQHIDPQQLQIYKCSRCTYKTRYKYRFQVHSKKHDLIYCCEKCAFVAGTIQQLRLHQITHQVKVEDHDLKYRCDKCDYKTYRLYSFNVHKLNHLRPDEIQYFYCYHCSFKAKRKDNLKTHVLKHFKKDEVTLQCFICDFSTKQRHLLISHIDKHSKVQNQPQVLE